MIDEVRRADTIAASMLRWPGGLKLLETMQTADNWATATDELLDGGALAETVFHAHP